MVPCRIDILAEDFRVLSEDHSFTSGCSTLWLLAYVHHQSQAYTDCQKEKEKRRHYDERVREVEHGTLAPLVFSTSGGMSPPTEVVYKRLASMVTDHQKKNYSIVINYIRCRLTFSLIRSTAMCLQASRSYRLQVHGTPDGAVMEVARQSCS